MYNYDTSSSRVSLTPGTHTCCQKISDLLTFYKLLVGLRGLSTNSVTSKLLPFILDTHNASVTAWCQVKRWHQTYTTKQSTVTLWLTWWTTVWFIASYLHTDTPVKVTINKCFTCSPKHTFLRKKFIIWSTRHQPLAPSNCIIVIDWFRWIQMCVQHVVETLGVGIFQTFFSHVCHHRMSGVSFHHRRWSLLVGHFGSFVIAVVRSGTFCAWTDILGRIFQRIHSPVSL